MADRWNWKALATAGAIMWGVYLALAALLAGAGTRMLWVSPESFRLLMGIYPGLAPGLAGALIGLVWGAVCGAICGGILAGLYNWAGKNWK